MLRGESSPSTRPHYVLDSYAVLALMSDEPGASLVTELLEAAQTGEIGISISLVNLGEVLYIEEREKGLPKAHEVLAYIDSLPIEIVPVDRSLALAAAHLKATSPISFADCFAAALSITRNALLVTGDPEFARIDPSAGLRLKWMPDPES